jgi:hypothetical protein
MEFKAGEEFPGSEDLIRFLNWADFGLYDTRIPFNWKQAEKEGPSKKIIIGREYLLVARPKKNQSLKEAFRETQGIGPAFFVEDPEDPRWKVQSGKPSRVVAFSRLTFYPEMLVARTVTAPAGPLADQVTIEYAVVVDTFKRFFIFLDPEECAKLGIIARDEALNKN